MSRVHGARPVVASRQLSVPRAERVEEAVLKRRRRAWSGPADGFKETDAVGMFPHFLAGGDLVADNRLLFATLLLRIQIIPDDGERGPTGTDVAAPEFPGRVACPVGGEPNAGQTAVAVWSAETGPVAGLQVQGPELMCGGRQGCQGFASAQFCQKSLLGRGTRSASSPLVRSCRRRRRCEEARSSTRPARWRQGFPVGGLASEVSG